MFEEPMVECKACGNRHSLEEGASLGMRYFRCGGNLYTIESSWLIDEMNNGGDGSGITGM